MAFCQVRWQPACFRLWGERLWRKHQPCCEAGSALAGLRAWRQCPLPAVHRRHIGKSIPRFWHLGKIDKSGAFQLWQNYAGSNGESTCVSTKLLTFPWKCPVLTLVHTKHAKRGMCKSSNANTLGHCYWVGLKWWQNSPYLFSQEFSGCPLTSLYVRSFLFCLSICPNSQIGYTRYVLYKT